MTVGFHPAAMEIHSDATTVGSSCIGIMGRNIDVLNLVVGTNIELGTDCAPGLAYSIPLGNSTDQPFDSEHGVFRNWFHGP